MGRLGVHRGEVHPCLLGHLIRTRAVVEPLQLGDQHRSFGGNGPQNITVYRNTQFLGQHNKRMGHVLVGLGQERTVVLPERGQRSEVVQLFEGALVSGRSDIRIVTVQPFRSRGVEQVLCAGINL